MLFFFIRRLAYGGRKTHVEGLLCSPWCEHKRKGEVYTFADIIIALVALFVLGAMLHIFVGSSHPAKGNCPWPYHYNHSAQHCQ